MGAGATTATAFAALVSNCLDQTRANEAGLIAGRNPEYLHQFRVALRRLRSVFRIYRPLLEPQRHSALAAETAWLSALLGATRDWDVFLADTVDPLVQTHAASDGLAQFRRRCVARRQHHAGAMRHAMGTERYAMLINAIAKSAAHPDWRNDDESRRRLVEPAPHFATLRIAKLEKKSHRLADELDVADAEHRHRLRIACKQLRYAVDFFRSSFDREPVQAYLGGLARMQDVLGVLNDCATARRLLDCVTAGRNASSHQRIRTMLTARIDEREQENLAVLPTVCAAWRSRKAFC